jgi:dihydroorotase
VKESGDSVAATITPQHAMIDRNDLLKGGIRPHNYCLPIAKRSMHRDAVRDAMLNGGRKFFLGTDSAPHPKGDKESDCGCAGCFTASHSLELYAEIFFSNNSPTSVFEDFASRRGRDFYSIPLPDRGDTVTLRQEVQTIPSVLGYPQGSGEIVPFMAGQELSWTCESRF